MNFNETELIAEEITLRKGAQKASEIPADIIEQLNRGQIETVNLTEWLAVDHIKLLQYILIEFDMQQYADQMLSALQQGKGQPTMKTIAAVASEWLGLIRHQNDQARAGLLDQLAAHRSDSVRCWAAYMIGLDQLQLEQKLTQIRRFAEDHHFGVREIAWMAVREDVSGQLQQAIQLLRDWIDEEDANLRRFAIEVTRPRGVWARHIAQLKETPELGLPLLEPLKSDSSKYVQDSVANWLNDAAKSQPDWVIGVCRRWLEESDGKATKRITARAQRSIKA